MKKIITALVVIMLAVIFTVGASAETYLKGDINMDGRVSASDARLVLRVSASLETATEDQKLIADMNDDGRISALDARTVLRVSAKLEDGKGEISIGGTTIEPEEKTELLSGISMSIDDFMKKFGGMRELDTTDGTISYTNDYVTVVSDPEMISSGNISSISITGGDYMLCGVYAGMSADKALAMLKADRWIVKQENASQVTLSKVGMNIMLAKSGDTVSFVEYYLSVSVVRPDDQDTSTTQPPETTTQPPETTTQPPETTTQPPETTTQPPETTTQPPEITTKPPETTTQPPITNEDFNNLPEQAKAFLLGNFSLKGFSFNKDQRDPVTMYVTKDSIKAGMTMDTGDGKPLSVDVLVSDTTGNSTTYIICNETMKYCKLDALTMEILGMDPDNIKLNFNSIDPNKVVISDDLAKEGNVEYTVYKISTASETCEIYMIDENIKRICNYDSKNILISRIDVDEFSADVPASVFSLDKYKKELTIMTVFV